MSIPCVSSIYMTTLTTEYLNMVTPDISFQWPKTMFACGWRLKLFENLLHCDGNKDADSPATLTIVICTARGNAHSASAARRHPIFELRSPKRNYIQSVSVLRKLSLPPNPITYLLQSNQVTKGHPHLPTVELIKYNQSFSSSSLLSFSGNECLNCGGSQGFSVCFSYARVCKCVYACVCVFVCRN